MISYHKPYLINNEKNDKIKLNHFFSGALYSYGKQKETNELIFSWLSWLAVLLVGAHDDDSCGDDGAVAQRGRHAPNNRLAETCSLGLPCALWINDIML